MHRGLVIDLIKSTHVSRYRLTVTPEFKPCAPWDTEIEIEPRPNMNAKDFRRIALSFEGAEESSHMGKPDFRVGGRIFATLASEEQGYGNLMLTLEQQAAFVEELPDVFLPIRGGWGRMGMTHVRLAASSEDVLTGALRAAWKLRTEKNAKSGKKSRPRADIIRKSETRHKKR